MIIISWDVGIIHLAYCVLQYLHDEKTNKTSVRILDWDEINLVEDDRIKLVCCGFMKAKKGADAETCGKNATYYLQTPIDSKIYGFCKTHLLQHTNYWSEEKTKAMFKQTTQTGTCNFIKKDGTECEKNSKIIYKNDNLSNQVNPVKDAIESYYCTAHYKSELSKRIKDYSPQLIKNLIVKKYPTHKLQYTLVKKLDELSEHFAKLGVEEVIIENQPSLKHPKMKSIANTLFDYFIIRGYVDKIHNLDIQLVRFMCPSNKLKVNNDNTIEVFKANKDDKKKYKLTKALGIQYTKQLLNSDEEQLDYLDLYKKKDDICDAYLQGRYYLECIKNKKPPVKKTTTKRKPVKKIGGSKTTRKSREMEKLQAGVKTKRRKKSVKRQKIKQNIDTKSKRTNNNKTKNTGKIIII